MGKTKDGLPDERALNAALVEHLRQTTEHYFYAHIDADTGGVRHKSAWDFLIAYKGRTVFYEGKVGKAALTDNQKLHRAQCLGSYTPYRVVRFFNVEGLWGFDVMVETEKGIVKPARHISEVSFSFLFD